MKSNIRLFLFITVLMVIPSVVISAQGEHPDASKSLEEGRPEHRVRMTPEHRAKIRTDEMHEAVSLNDKQYKKIYRIFLKEEKFKKILSPEQYSTWRRIYPDPTGFFHK